MSSDTEHPEEGADDALEGEDGELLDGEVLDDQGSHAGGTRRVHVQAASFRGPLPPPDTLRAYDEVNEGLAGDIVEQWKKETAHRHKTIDMLTATDRQAMKQFYAGEKRGQFLGFAVILAILGVVILAIVMESEVIGLAALLTAGAAAIWAMRRSSTGGAPEPVELGDGDSIEQVPARDDD